MQSHYICGTKRVLDVFTLRFISLFWAIGKHLFCRYCCVNTEMLSNFAHSRNKSDKNKFYDSYLNEAKLEILDSDYVVVY